MFLDVHGMAIDMDFFKGQGQISKARPRMVRHGTQIQKREEGTGASLFEEEWGASLFNLCRGHGPKGCDGNLIHYYTILSPPFPLFLTFPLLQSPRIAPCSRL